jgi:hypothetical protein
MLRFLFIQSSLHSPILTVNFWEVVKDEDYATFSRVNGKPIMTVENLEKINVSSKMRSFNQTIFDKRSVDSFFTTPRVTKKNIFTGKIDKKSLKMITIKSSVYLVFFQQDLKTHEHELKIFKIKPETHMIKQIKCRLLFILENSNKGSSKTQYEFNIFKSFKFPKGKPHNCITC